MTKMSLAPRRSAKVLCLLAVAVLAVIRLVLTASSVYYHPCVEMYYPDNDASSSRNSTWRRRKIRMPRTMMHPTADALDLAPETGLNSMASFVLQTEGVLEHLEYQYGGASSRRQIMHRLATTEPLVYFVTPTYYRATQMADMTRLAQTLMHDKQIYWIVLEDRNECTIRIRALLERTGLPFAHLAIPTDPAVKAARLVRGASQRNRGLEIVEEVNLPGVVYFGDDDNSYDVRLFNQIRQTRTVGVMGVLTSIGPYERCLVNSTTGKVQGFLTHWPGNRTYQIDMAGFSFHTRLLAERKPRFRNDWPRGFLETNFIHQLIDSPQELEPLDNCTKLYSWHVRTSASGPNVDKPQRVGADPEYQKVVPAV